MNIIASLFMALSPAEQRNTIEALVFAASKDEALTLENLRNVVLSDIIKEHNKTKKNTKIHPAINEYLNNVENHPYHSKVGEPPDEPPPPDLEEILPLKNIAEIIKNINQDLEQSGRPYRIVEFASCYQFATLPQYGQVVESMLTAKTRKRFTSAQLETLAIIAYKQPITKPEIDKIRGVMSSSEIINVLTEKELVAIAGRKDIIGKPLLYVTTDEFLRVFGLNQLADLPRLTEIEEIAEQKLREEESKTEPVLDITSADRRALPNSPSLEEWFSGGVREESNSTATGPNDAPGD